MNLGEHVFLYCERGTNAALLAEPINAISNLAFLFAALVGLQLVLGRPRDERSADHYLLVGLVFLIGLGSLAFHLFATQRTELADVIPICVFILVYLGFALNRFLGVPPGWTVIVLIAFTAIMSAATQVKCWNGGTGIPGADVQGVKPCLNGSIFYLPALAALVVVGLLAEERRHRAAPYLLWAAAIFAVSVTLRSLDMALCDRIVIEGAKVGTHFAWHVLNGLALFLLLRASLEAGPYGEAVAKGDSTQLEEAPVRDYDEVRAEAQEKADRLAQRVVEVEVPKEEPTPPKEEPEPPKEEPEPPKEEPKPKVFFPT